MKTKFIIAILLLTFFFGCKENSVNPAANNSSNNLSALSQTTKCVNLTDLEYPWNISFTIVQNYTDINTITDTKIIYPFGYLNLNANTNYNVYSNGASLNGNWMINPLNCQLIFDKGTTLERAFTIDLLTLDSLTLSRKDTINKIIYKQHYSKKANTPVCGNVPIIEFKWYNNYTIVKNYIGDNTITSINTLYVNSYLKLNTNRTYNFQNNGVVQNGRWLLDPITCQLTFDKGTLIERIFTINTATKDSLVILRKDTVNKIIYEEHYGKNISQPSCVSLPSLEYQWDNVYTILQNYIGTNTIVNTNIIYPIGYFILLDNNTYDVLSNGVPNSGSWLINPQNCQLTLDKGTFYERSFNIDLLTTDSLIISRKDIVNGVIYKQHYVKNH